MANRQRTGRTDGADKRGNSRDRAARRAWLLLTFGDGESAPCALTLVGSCSGSVTDATMEVDRIIPGALGGRYTRDNIRPACRPCNEFAGHETKRLVAAGRVSE